MFKVTFSFEDGSVVEAYANAGPMWRSMHHVPETEPAENAVSS